MKSSESDTARPHVARRLRAPLMGRSADLASLDDDSDETGLDFDKRRLNQIFLGRRRMINPKRRGPLFG